MRPQRRLAVLLLLACGLLAGRAAAQPQTGEPQVGDGLPVKRIEFRGLQRISEGFVRGIIRTRPGQAYSRRLVQQDVRALLRTRKFYNVFADAKLEDGQVVVVFSFEEKPTVRAVEVEGNKHFPDEQLLAEIGIQPGDALDRYAIQRGREAIEDKYRSAGYHYVRVEIDELALRSDQRVVYRIVEGPRVHVRRIRFEGARSFPVRQLRLKIRSRTRFLFFFGGVFDEDLAERDALALQAFYRDEGFLDARVGYRLDFEDVERRKLTLTFVIEEGPRYRIHDIRFFGNRVFSDDRIRGVLKLRVGDVLRQETLRRDIQAIEELYGRIGYADVRVDARHRFLEEPGKVVLEFHIAEGPHYRIGRVVIRGNTHTQDKVIRRELGFWPTEDFNTVAMKQAERRLLETGLFKKARITPLKPEGEYRDVLVEVEEGTQVDFLVGVGVSTDLGVIGSLSINNRNFDLFDWPRTFGEFIRGEAFRGAGQRMRLVAEPGTRVSRFRIDFTEPYLLDRPLRLDTSVYLFQRIRDSFDEERLGFTFGLSKRFTTGRLAGWAVEGSLRVENVQIDNLRPLVADEIFRTKGNTFLTSVRATIVRDTTDSRLMPTEGYRLSFAYEQVGALGGEEAFGRPAISFAWYRTVRTDIFDRKSVLAMRLDAGWIIGDAPVFERFFGGGWGSIRGFDYRGVSPRAGLFDDRIGGDFILLAGAEYSFPLYGQTLRGVTFVDMGTVEEDFEITQWRVAVGFGLRVNVQYFGAIPLVFDFGWPIVKDDDDNTRVFTFSFGASF